MSIIKAQEIIDSEKISILIQCTFSLARDKLICMFTHLFFNSFKYVQLKKL